MRARQKLAAALVGDSPFSRKLGATGPGSERSDRQLVTACQQSSLAGSCDHSGWQNLYRLREWFLNFLPAKPQLHIQPRWRLHGGRRVMSQLNKHFRSFAENS
jgi:hypothetical protein